MHPNAWSEGTERSEGADRLYFYISSPAFRAGVMIIIFLLIYI